MHNGDNKRAWIRLAQTIHENAKEIQRLTFTLADMTDPTGEQPIDMSGLQGALRVIEEDLGAMKCATFAMQTVLKQNANGRKGVH